MDIQKLKENLRNKVDVLKGLGDMVPQDDDLRALLKRIPYIEDKLDKVSPSIMAKQMRNLADDLIALAKTRCIDYYKYPEKDAEFYERAAKGEVDKIEVVYRYAIFLAACLAVEFMYASAIADEQKKVN